MEDDELPGTRVVAEVLRGIERELQRAHPSETDYLASLYADAELLREELQYRVDELTSLKGLQEKLAGDPLALELASVMADVKTDEDAWELASALSSQFRRADGPSAVDLDVSADVAPIDMNNPAGWQRPTGNPRGVPPEQMTSEQRRLILDRPPLTEPLPRLTGDWGQEIAERRAAAEAEAREIGRGAMRQAGILRETDTP